MPITNLYKEYKKRWDTWLLAWENNTVRSWDELAGEIHTNASKVSVGETWDTVSTTWATESRTWLAVSQLFTNVALSSTAPLWSSRTFPWQEALPWQNTNAGIINVSKP